MLKISNRMMSSNFKLVDEFIHNRIQINAFKGYDPFDGLNSSLFIAFPFLKRSRAFKLLWLQFFKHSPINFRYIAGVKKGYNPKGLGLFLSAYCNLYHQKQEDDYLEKMQLLIEKIINCKSEGYSGICWGYNFDWQARAFFQPMGTPSVVVTSFVACALLDAYEITKDEKLLKIARSACDFVLNDLNRTYDSDGDFAFSYCPVDNTQVFNASLLGTRLLCRVYAYTKEEVLINNARMAVAFACKHQHENGAWAYSPLKFHQWIDNFHTGYNLECIYTYQTVSGDNSFQSNIDKGLEYYTKNFFEPNGMPKYYNTKSYPVDLHNTAQLIITMSRLNVMHEHKALVDKVVHWTMENMYDKKRGCFYYQKNKYYTNKISYMRWTQAWMFYGLSEYKKY